MCSVTSLSGMPKACAARRRPLPGIWLLVQISQLAVFEMRRAILRLERRVRDERIRIRRFHHLRGCTHGRVGVAIFADGPLRRLFAQFLRPLRKGDAAAVGSRTFVPVHLQLLARRLRVPPGLGDDGDAVLQARIAWDDSVGNVRARHYKGILDARQFLDLIDIRADHLAAEDAALLEYGVEHARHHDVDAEDRLARDDGRQHRVGSG